MAIIWVDSGGKRPTTRAGGERGRSSPMAWSSAGLPSRSTSSNSEE
jgi:hypothetical protein